jgi:2-(3-amino-3-carboxypropyl)histidine synthase
MVDNHDTILDNIFRDFIFDLDEVINWIKAYNIKTLAIQVPEGIKRQTLALMSVLEERCAIVPILIADPCFGACDLAVNKLIDLDIDGLLHLGHSEIPNLKSDNDKIPIKYIELKLKHDKINNTSVENLVGYLKSILATGTAIGLVCSVQYLDMMINIKEILENEGFKIIIGPVSPRMKHPGQVLGCNFYSAKGVQNEVSAFLFIGDGKFHPLGIALVTDKPVYSYNPINGTIEDLLSFRESILKQRGGAISKVKSFRKFGIIVSLKPGQNRFDMAIQIRDKLKSYQMEGTIICMDNISPDRIDYLPLEAFVNTACPRLAIDDYLIYKKPIITPIELEIILGERDWENYEFDEIV